MRCLEEQILWKLKWRVSGIVCAEKLLGHTHILLGPAHRDIILNDIAQSVEHDAMVLRIFVERAAAFRISDELLT